MPMNIICISHQGGGETFGERSRKVQWARREFKTRCACYRQTAEERKMFPSKA